MERNFLGAEFRSWLRKAMKLNQRELLNAITKTECPFCDDRKRSGAMFCEACYAKLPIEIKKNITYALRLSSEALKAGVNFLEDGK